ncbi:hypothetical protein BOTBODRAFT_205413 [Botryobasidium botryosum FD-172 SS1]|uniref:W2 domain-containing protein n=1 Tax=Botryobasidium botryosum (strain FD-172 SS1) TaxID=930990 RepID=A0A067N0X9_BOTB1|nr:hypothetical protein BOTBODRAFT_205413 [Botryobasidium botryosum FD-172 SS1]
MSQQTNVKPSLQGVRIKARKGAVKAQAKHEPEIFQAQLYKHLETVSEGDFDNFAVKLVSAGQTLEFLKYADALFEILLVGGLLQPGGSYVDDTPAHSPFSIINAKEPVEIDEIKKYVEVINKLIRRYKYLQKTLDQSTLPNLLQYTSKWGPALREKLAVAVSLFMSQGLTSSAPLSTLTKDHLIKDEVSINFITVVFKTYLLDQSMEHLSATLKRGGVKDLLNFFPENKRDPKHLETHFKAAGLPQIAEWYAKRQSAVAKEAIVQKLKVMCEAEETPEDIIVAVQAQQAEQPLPDADLVGSIWQGLMGSVDWSARPDQIEGLALREVTKYTSILEKFCNGPKTEVALLNAVQVYCYEDTRIMKAFLQMLKVLYNKDVLSAQAIIYWHQKGAKPQGKQHFLKQTEALVKFLQEQDSDEEDDDDE